MIKKNLIYSILISIVSLLPLYFAYSIVLMIVLQATGLKHPDQYLEDVLPFDPLEFAGLVFISTIVIAFLVLTRLNRSKK